MTSFRFELKQVVVLPNDTFERLNSLDYNPFDIQPIKDENKVNVGAVSGRTCGSQFVLDSSGTQQKLDCFGADGTIRAESIDEVLQHLSEVAGEIPVDYVRVQESNGPDYVWYDNILRRNQPSGVRKMPASTKLYKAFKQHFG